MTIREILLAHLEATGLDGLYNRDGECACLAGDLAPCGEIREGCAVGRRVPCDGTLDGCPCGFHVVAVAHPDLTPSDEKTRP